VVREERTNQGIAQETLAHLAGIERSHMGKIERGEHVPTLPLILKIARALKCSSAHLMAAMEGLYRTFGLESLPLQWLRNRGLDLVDQWSPLKNWLSAQATGLQPPAMGGSTKIAHQDP
jgi:transcriptional regulator with XRE-family HTH domain